MVCNSAVVTIYGIHAPGMPNVAGGLARNLTHINGYAEGTGGAVFDRGT